LVMENDLYFGTIFSSSQNDLYFETNRVYIKEYKKYSTLYNSKQFKVCCVNNP
jgi:hypothetical protein